MAKPHPWRDMERPNPFRRSWSLRSSVVNWFRDTEPDVLELIDGDSHYASEPVGVALGEDGFDLYRTEDDDDECPRLREFYRSAFELADLLQARRLRPAAVLGLQQRWNQRQAFWQYVDPHASAEKPARLAGAIVLWECNEHVLQVARHQGAWKVFSGSDNLPIDVLHELEVEETDTFAVSADVPEANVDDTRIEDDLTDEDLELRQLRDDDTDPQGMH